MSSSLRVCVTGNLVAYASYLVGATLFVVFSCVVMYPPVVLFVISHPN